jgi:L-malate glycosyltransferase
MYKVKILYVIGQLGVGGTEWQLLELVKHLDKIKYIPFVVCLTSVAPLADSFRKSGCQIYVLNREKQGRFKTVIDLIRIIKEINPDIVHSFSYAIRAGVLATKISGTSRIVVSFRTDPNRWVTLIDRILISAADLILENSNYALRAYQKIVGWEENRSKIVFNGIDIEVFDRISEEKLLNPMFGSSGKGNFIICVVSVLRPVKKLENLLIAHSLLLQKMPNVELWIVGDGEMRKKLEESSQYLNTRGQVFFWGIRSDVPSILRYANIGVLVSEHEGVPNAIIEYMAARLPVVATDVGGNREVIVDNETGILVPFANSEALVNALLLLLNDPLLARNYGEAGRRRVEQLFSLERMVKETEAIYEALIN